MNNPHKILQDALEEVKTREDRRMAAILQRNQEDMRTWLANFPKFKDWPVVANVDGVFIILPNCVPIEVLAPSSPYADRFVCKGMSDSNINDVIAHAHDLWARDQARRMYP